MRDSRSGCAVCLLLLSLTGCVADDTPGADEAERREPATPGAAGIGDVLFPGLGNGGYEVTHYSLDLCYATAAPTQPLDGTVTMLARATQALSQLDLDFAGDRVGAVAIDGIPAAFARSGDELVITPPRPLFRGEFFVITVAHFRATPAVASSADFLNAPFFSTPDGSAWALQPNNAHRVFPSNDHPRDKASFDFRIDVPAGTTAVANGALISTRTAGGRTVWRYLQPEPMATELAQVTVGAFDVVERGAPHGVHVRDVLPTRLAAALAPKLAIEIDQIEYLRARLGDYPFRSYGTLVVEADLGFALETQSLSLFQSTFFDADPTSYARLMMHELAHQWFGDSVAPARWSDVWLSEGHATWYEYTSDLGEDGDALDNRAHSFYQFGDLFREFLGPVASPPGNAPQTLFNSNVYNGGFLVLYALRQQVGDAAFRAIERAWVTEKRGRSATTEDFIALASRVSGQDLTAFLTDWLFGTVTPPMPGHPDWVQFQFFGAPPALPAHAKY